MFLLLAVLLAQPAPPEKPQPEPATAERAPLSKEDQELVKQLALLEQLDLLKNLELFEEDKDGDKPPPPQRQP